METKLERIKKDIAVLSQFTATPGKGMTRLSLTEEDRKSRDYLKNAMKDMGLLVREDAAGTVVGRMEGSLKDGPVVMVGSHFDSVKNGGVFDGPAGIAAALETARVIKEKNIKIKYPLEIVAMIEEEGARFGAALFGSRSMTGKIDKNILLSSKDEHGISMYEAMKKFGLNPEDIAKAARDAKDLKAFIELHIEQGPVLEKYQEDIGIVDFIVGIHEFKVIVRGRADHAGTTPMDMRADALDAAAKVISRVSTNAKKAGEGTVATVGIMSVKPGSANIVPSEVMFTVDIRGKNSQHIDQVLQEIERDLREITVEKGVEYEVINLVRIEPVRLPASIIERFKHHSKALGLAYRIMSSGAGHDAMVMAGITKVGLIFVPSQGGRSHCPQEWTDYESLQKGVEVVYNTVLDLVEVVK